MVQDSRESLYHTYLINEDGVDGVTYSKGEQNVSLVVSSPLNDLPGTNPEELFGMAQSTCLNATIRALLRGRDLEDHRSVVKTRVDFKKERMGYYFDVTVYAAIEGLSEKDAARIIHAAERRCPVSKLVQGSETVDLEILPYEELSASDFGE